MNTDQAFTLLKEAGITDNHETFRRWLREGKFKATGFTIDEQSLRLFINEYTHPDKDEFIRQLKLKIKAQDTQIKGLEELHETTTKNLIKQRNQLHKEMIMLKSEENKLRKDMMDLLRENIELRNKLNDLKEKRVKENKSDNHHVHPSSQLNNYNQKLGLSKMASTKDVVAGYKELLKISHPDHGGNAKLFQYLKTDYDYFKKSVKR